MATPETVVLGLGSSHSDALGWLRRAVAALKAEAGLRIARVSAIYRSDAMLPPAAPPDWDVPYLNLALACQWSDHDPERLLSTLKDVERALGRRRRERWAPREIDIDLLAFGEQVIEIDQLSVPHAGLLDRPFALLPLADVAPEWVHPACGLSATELARTWRNAPVEEVPFRTRATAERLTEIMGIINVTPDSFSDGGRLSKPEIVAARAGELVAAGATVLDIGAESTRPGATPVGQDEEWRRLEPALHELARLRERGARFRISVDTRHAATARRALAIGADWINDVEGLGSIEMIEAVRESACDLVFMHSLGVPPSRDRLMPLGEDPIQGLLRWAERRIAELQSRGIPRSRLIFDPGIGFGKSVAQNWRILRGADRLHELGLRVLVGCSRKSFLSSVTASPAAERDFESAWIGDRLASMGIECVRVHDVALQRRAFALASAWMGMELRISASVSADRRGEALR